MLPKLSKSQFRTPFRGHAGTVHSPVSTQSQCQEPSLAATPNLGFFCSQMSTPGITVDAIKDLMRKPTCKTTVGAGVTHKKSASKKPVTKKAGYHGLANQHANKNQTNLKGPNMTSAARKEAKRQSERPNEDGIVKKKRVSVEHTAVSCTSEYGCLSEEINVAQGSITESLGRGENESPVIPFQTERVENGQRSRKQLQETRNPVQKKNIRSMKLSSVIPKPGVKPPKSGKTSTAKKNVKQIHILKKGYETNGISITGDGLSIGTARDGDDVVIVGQNDYVYREEWEEVTNTKDADVYKFTSTSPDEQTTLTGRQSVRKWRKDQVRLQVLKTIYKVETELAVLRERRKRIRSKLDKGERSSSYL